jgi:hypothetical protein
MPTGFRHANIQVQAVYEKWAAEKDPGLFIERQLTYKEAKEIIGLAEAAIR